MGQWAPGAFAHPGRRRRRRRTCRSNSAGSRSRPSTAGPASRPTPSAAPTASPWARTPHPKRSTSCSSSPTQENQETWAADSGLPVNHRPIDAVTDPNMQAVLEGLNNADVHAAVPRPVLHGRGREPGQRPDRAAVRRPDVTARTPPPPSPRRPAADAPQLRPDVGGRLRASHPPDLSHRDATHHAHTTPAPTRRPRVAARSRRSCADAWPMSCCSCCRR